MPAQRTVAAQLRDPPVQRPVALEERRRVVDRRLHALHDPVEVANVARPVVAGSVALDQRLERVPHLEAFLVARALRSEPEHGVAHRDPDRRTRDEHAASGSRPRLDHAARLEQPHGLVHGRDGDPEPLAEVILGAEPLARLAFVDDLALELTRHELRARHARAEQSLGADAH